MEPDAIVTILEKLPPAKPSWKRPSYLVSESAQDGSYANRGETLHADEVQVFRFLDMSKKYFKRSDKKAGGLSAF